MADFESALREVLPEASDSSPYAPALRAIGDERGSALRSSLYNSTSIQPDRAARDYELMKKYDLPIDTVRRQRDEIERRDSFNRFDFDDLEKNTPVLAGELSDPAKAGILKDDIRNLSLIERIWGDTKQSVAHGASVEPLGRIGMKRMIMGDEALDPDEWLTLRRSQEQQVIDYDLGFAQRIPGNVAEVGTQMADMVFEPLLAAGATMGIGTVGGAASGSAGGVPGAVAGGGVGFRASWPAAGIAFNTGMVSQAFIAEAGNAYNEFASITDTSGNAIDRELAAGGALLAGAVNGALEYGGAKYIISSFPGAGKFMNEMGRKEIRAMIRDGIGADAMRMIGKAWLTGGLVEGSTEGMQEFTNVAVGELMKLVKGGEFEGVLTTDDPMQRQQMIEDAMTRIGEAFEVGLTGGGTIHAAGTVLSMGTEATVQHAQYLQEQSVIEERKNTVRQAETASRSPEVMREFLEKLPSDTVYIDGVKAREFFQSADPAIYAEFERVLPDAAEQLAEAAQLGGDIVLPSHRVDFMFSQTNALDGLQKIMRLTPESLAEDDARAAAERIIPELDMTESEFGQQRAEVERTARDLEDRISYGLTASGKYNASNAQQVAAFMRQVYETQATRATGSEKLANVISDFVGGIAIAPRPMTKIPPDRYDDLINMARDSAAGTLKTKAQTPQKKPIQQWIRKNGGVRIDSPLAGELRAMDITPKTAPGLFKKDSGLSALDNFPANEFIDSFDAGKVEEDGNGYVSEGFLLNALRDETFGKLIGGVSSQEDDGAVLDDMIRTLDELGIDVSKLTNEEVKAALARAQQDGRSFNQPANPDVDPNREVNVVDLRKNTSFKTPQELRQKLRALAAENDTMQTADAERFIKLLPRGMDHAVWSSIPKEARRNETIRNRSLNDLEKLVASAVLIESVPNKKADKKKKVAIYHRFYVPVRVGNGIHAVRIVAEQTKNGLKYRPDEFLLYDVIPEKGPLPQSQYSQKAPVSMEGGDKITIREMLSGVKDTAGKTYFQSSKPLKTDTESFKKWFGDSKVVDADGKPLVVYHGTKRNFSQFDLDEQGRNGRRYGEGLYFTADARRASSYGKGQGGNVIPVYLKAENIFFGVEQLNDKQREQYLTSEGEKNDVLQKMGFDASASGEDFYEIVVFDPTQIKSVHNRGSFDQNDARILFQGDSSGPRGSVQFLNYKTLINLFEGADLSTALHEAGHIWLEMVRRVYGHSEATDQMRTDLNVLYAWWEQNAGSLWRDIKASNPFAVRKISDDLYAVTGMSGERGRFKTEAEAKAEAARLHAGIVKDIQSNGGKDYIARVIRAKYSPQSDAEEAIFVAMDEYFARGFEAYLMKGEAPSIEVIGMFERFRQWLLKVYNYAADSLGVTISPEIQGFFDRLIATDGQIEALKNNPLFRADPQVMQMLTVAEREDYIRRGEKAERQARNTLFRKATRQFERQYAKWWKEEHAVLREEIAAQVGKEPVYVAIAAARDQKLDKSVVKMLIGDAAAKSLPRGILAASGGVSPGMVADLTGFKNSQAMLDAMLKAEDIKERIDRLTDEKMLERHGDMMRDGTIQTEALNTAMNAAKGDQIAYEMRIIYRQFGVTPPNREAFIARAQQVLDGTAIGKIRPSSYYNNVVRAARESGKALAKKDYKKAAEWKAKQLLNHELYRMSTKSKKDIDKALSKFKDYQNRPSGKIRLDEDYRLKIVQILSPFDFGPRMSVARKTRLEMQALHAWAQQKQEDDGAVLVIPPELEAAAEKQNYQDMSLSEFMALRDTVYNIATQGELKRKFIVKGQERDFDEVKQQVVDAIEKNIRLKTTEFAGAESGLVSAFKDYVASHLKSRTIVREMDGFKDNGVVHQYMMDGIDDAMDRETTRRGEAGEQFRNILLKHFTKSELRSMSGFFPDLTGVGTVNIPGVGQMTLENRIMVLLNWGNEGNREALMEGGIDGRTKLFEAQVEAILDTLEKRHFEFAQEVWDWIGGFWPEIEALEKRTKGYAPERVEPTPFYAYYDVQTPGGGVTKAKIEMRGGYLPIKADPKKSVIAGEQDIKEEMKSMVGYSSTQTRRSHTIERIGPNTAERRPLHLKLNVVTGHVASVIHDLEMREVLTQTSRLLRTKTVKDAMSERLGQANYKQMDLWVKDLASGEQGGTDWLSVLNDTIRANATIAYMGFKVSTGLTQVSGMAQSAAALGKGAKGWYWIGQGAKNVLKNYSGNDGAMALTAIHEKSEYMKNRHFTFHRDIRQANELWRNDARTSSDFRRMAMWHIMQMQKVIDYITWSGAYQKALTDQMNEDAAVRFANNAVRAQASGLLQDLSGIERGTLNSKTRQNRLVKLITMMYSYFNAKLQIGYEKTKTTDFSKPEDVTAYIADMVNLVLLDAILTAALLDALPDKDDDESWMDFIGEWSWFLAKQPLAMLVLGRDVAGSLEGFDVETPLEALFKSLGRFKTQVAQGDIDKALIKSGADFAGLTFGLPSGEAKNIIDLIDRAASGEEVEYKDFVRSRRPDER